MNFESIKHSRDAASGLAKAWALSLFPPISFLFGLMAALVALLFAAGDRGARAPAFVALAFTFVGFFFGFLGMHLIHIDGWGFDGLALMAAPGLFANFGWAIARRMYDRRLSALDGA